MFSIVFTGDVAFSKYFKKGYENKNLLSDKIKDFLNSADYVVANVEAPVTNLSATLEKPLVHTNDLESVKFLADMNMKVWNLANNHSMDCGEDGLIQTLDAAKNYGIKTVGAGFNKKEAATPLILEGENVKVGILSVASNFSVIATDNSAGCLLWDNYKVIKEKISEIKNQCDYCVVVVHGGEEFTQIPLPYARNKYKKYLKFGADYVVGHHPHVPQNYERFGDKIIFYSLGNFIFDTDYQRQQRNTDIGVLLKLEFEKGNCRFSSLSTKIDRKNGVIVDTQPLFIFQNIDKKEYRKLIPYADIDFSINLKRKHEFLGQTEKVRTKITFFNSKLKRFKARERFWIYKTLVLRLFKPWKSVDKNMLDYLDGGIKN